MIMATPTYNHGARCALDFPEVGAAYAKKDAQTLAIKYNWQAVDVAPPPKPTDAQPVAHWRWVASCAPTKDIRYYINRVFVSPLGAWATDGYSAHWAPIGKHGAAPWLELPTCRIPAALAKAPKMLVSGSSWITGDGLQWGATNTDANTAFEARVGDVFKIPSARDFTPCVPCPDPKLFAAVVKAHKYTSIKAGLCEYLEAGAYVRAADHLPPWQFNEQNGPRISLALLLRAIGGESGWRAAHADERWYFQHDDGRGAVIMPMKG
jgi:hypothetical protein